MRLQFSCLRLLNEMRGLVYCKYWLWKIDLGHSTVKTTISFNWSLKHHSTHIVYDQIPLFHWSTQFFPILSLLATGFFFFIGAHSFPQFCLWLSPFVEDSSVVQRLWSPPSQSPPSQVLSQQNTQSSSWPRCSLPAPGPGGNQMWFVVEIKFS